jgi:sugar phosphate isomerase/epimerase
MLSQNKHLSRRGFLGASAALSAVLLAPAGAGRLLAGAEDASPSKPAPSPAKKRPIGLELYSVRGELQRDPNATLRAVAAMGYEVVEFYAPYYGWSIPHTKNVRALMEDLGLRCYSTHNSFQSFTPGAGMSKAIEMNQILGVRQIILSSAPGSAKGLEGWKKLCGDLAAAVEQLKPHGLSAGFHNHQTEWAPLEGNLRTMDVLAANTPPEFILQLDVGTCVEAGADPVAWVKANPGRIKSMHLKDWAPGEASAEKSFRVLFGEGVSPWKELIATAESVGGVEHYLLEQEGSRFSEFETARRCLENWKKFRA